MPKHRDDRDEEKPRTCLRCLGLFLSQNAGNRICPTCADKPVVLSGLRRISLDLDSLTSERNSDDDSSRQAE